MTDGTLFTGKSVEDAIADGLRSLGLTQEQVEVEIISRGSRGLFGIGSEPAQVRLTPRNAARSAEPQPAPATPAQPAVEAAPRAPVQVPDEPVIAAERHTAPAAATEAMEIDEDLIPPAYDADEGDTGEGDTDEEDEGRAVSPRTSGTSAELDSELAPLAVELLSETVRMMGFDGAEVVASWQEPDADNDEPYLLLNVDGRDLGALIGRRGETLNNLQYLLRLMVNQRLHEWKNIVVDVQQYRQHRAQHLAQLAIRSAEQVAKTGRPLSLEPMPSNERRIIHLALRDSTTVYTESSGDGERRKVQILPKRS